MQLLTNTNFDFISKAKFSFILSMVLILVGIGSLIISGGPNLSIDFTGGTILQVKITPAPDITDVRAAIEAAGFEGVQVQDFGAADEFLLTSPSITNQRACNPALSLETSILPTQCRQLW